jgi:hypothetical protein
MLGIDARGTCGSCGAEVASSEAYCLIHTPMQRAGKNAPCTEPKARGNEKAVADVSDNRPDCALERFLDDCKDRFKDYKEFATHVEGICREILDKMDIKGLVTSRAKESKSLAEKLPDRAKKWSTKVARRMWRSRYMISPGSG